MTVLNRQPPVAEPPDPPRRRDRTHWLYIAVIGAVVAGVVVGLVAPDVGKSVGVLGTMFVALIKMMIAPVIFCTIVLGIGSVRKAATVGKVGGLAFVYFLTMSSFALAIGLVVGNLIHPGSGMHLSESAAGKGAELAEKAHESGGLMDLSSTSFRSRCRPDEGRLQLCRAAGGLALTWALWAADPVASSTCGSCVRNPRRSAWPRSAPSL
jgi:aerobic C4-dicarboxylate transport protein